MADEIKASLTLSCDNANYSERFSVSNVKVSQTTQAGAGGVVTVGTAVQTLSLGAVTSAGYAAFRNLNALTSGTHAIYIGTYDGTNNKEVVKLQRGMAAVLPLVPNITIGLRHETSSVYASSGRLQYLVLSE
jgi:16S rRNA U1498 N3-methylase RsmE